MNQCDPKARALYFRWQYISAVKMCGGFEGFTDDFSPAPITETSFPEGRTIATSMKVDARHYFLNQPQINCTDMSGTIRVNSYGPNWSVDIDLTCDTDNSLKIVGNFSGWI
jgi:hypothetical protein